MIFVIRNKAHLNLEFEDFPNCPVCGNELLFKSIQQRIIKGQKFSIIKCLNNSCKINNYKNKQIYYEFLSPEELKKQKDIIFQNRSKHSKKNSKWSIEYWMNKGFTEDEAKIKVTEVQSINAKKVKNTFSKYNIQYWLIEGFTEDEAKIKAIEFKNQNLMSCKKGSCWNVEFWLKNGFTEEEAIEKVKDAQKQNSNKFHKKRRENPDEYEQWSTLTIEYWLKKGLSEEEARIALADRQNTNSLEKFIERYGEEEGKARYDERNEKWQNTLNSKPQEEIDRINRLKGSSLEILLEKFPAEQAIKKYVHFCEVMGLAKKLETYIEKFGEEEGTKKYIKSKQRNLKSAKYFGSKESMKLLIPIYKFCRKLGIERKDIYLGVKGSHEYCIFTCGKFVLYDFTIKSLKLMIEYNGIAWHPNPKWTKYRWNAWKQAITNKNADEIYQKDLCKNKVAEEKGFKVYTIFSDDNKKDFINKFIEDVNEEINKRKI